MDTVVSPHGGKGLLSRLLARRRAKREQWLSQLSSDPEAIDGRLAARQIAQDVDLAKAEALKYQDNTPYPLVGPF